MSRYVRGWICDGCEKFVRSEPWNCPGCGKEVCELCFYTYAHCPACSEGKDDETLRLAANATGNFEFD